MCGIAGQICDQDFQWKDPKMISQGLQHRGPDHFGHYHDDHFQVIHQRLAIIDPSANANQPMVHKNESGNIVLAFNGEIYNYKDLRKVLTSQGHKFNTESDTEVLLKLYLQHGLRCVEYLNGMFAISIWDERQQTLHLIRDRLGIKPLYYFQDQNRFIFSSNINSILKTIGPVDLNQEAYLNYSRFRFNALDESIYKGVFKLPPGHTLTLKRGNVPQFDQYWSLSSKKRELQLNFSDSADYLFELLSDSITLRSSSDTRISTFLSGGIDSSIILAIASRVRPNITAINCSMGPDNDEAGLAEQLTEQLDIPLRKIGIKAYDYLLYPKVIQALDEPLGDSIIVPTYRLGQEASLCSKVVLSGEGADEIFGGYVHHLAMVYAQLLHSLFPWLSNKRVLRLLNKIPQGLWEAFFPYPHKLGKSGVKRLLNFLSYQESPLLAYHKLIELIPLAEQKYEKEPDYTFEASNDSSLPLFNYWNALDHEEFLQNLISYDLRFWNSSYTLERLDRLTMAHSVEARVPFLDHRIVEFSQSLPQKFLIKRGVQKRILRQAVIQNIPSLKNQAQRKKYPFFISPSSSYSKEFKNLLKKRTNPSKTDGVLQDKIMFSNYLFSEFLKTNHSNFMESSL